MDRQFIRFRERDLDESLLSTSKFRMVEAVLEVPGFGIEPQLLEEVPDRPFALDEEYPVLITDGRSETRSLTSCTMVSLYLVGALEA